MTRIHDDPRESRRRRHRAPDVDHLAAAVRLDLSLSEMRARDAAAGAPARGADEPPTGLIDLDAIRALLGQPTTGEPDPAAVAWLAGGADPAAAAVVEQVDYLDQIAQAQPALAETSIREHFDAQLADAVAAINATADDRHTALELTAAALADAEPELPTLGELYRADGAHLLAGAWEASAAEPAFRSDPVRGPGWRSRHDPRSLQFGARKYLAGTAPLADRMWWPGTVGDQGSEGACVGWGIVDAVNARAAGDVDLTAADAEKLYARAQQLDDVPGADYTGTSVLAGLQAGVEAGLFGGYRWCFGTRDIAQAVLQLGPVVVGVPWLSGMYDTAPGGLVQLTGDDTGAGHCLAVVGVLLRGPQGRPGPYFVWQNSWGASYGDGGLGYVHHRDLAQLLHGVGEAAVPMAEPQR